MEIPAGGRRRYCRNKFAFAGINLIGYKGDRKGIVDLHAIEVEPFKRIVKALNRAGSIKQFNLDFEQVARRHGGIQRKNRHSAAKGSVRDNAPVLDKVALARYLGVLDGINGGGAYATGQGTCGQQKCRNFGFHFIVNSVMRNGVPTLTDLT